MSKIEAIREATEKCLEKADAIYGTKLAGNVEIRFDIRGYRMAGQAGFKHGHFYLRFHPEYIESNFDDMLSNTVPHEVAHIVGYATNIGIRRHNDAWKACCLKLGGNGKRCHSMDNKDFAPTAQERAAQYDARRPFAYKDEHGRVHYVTAQLHNKMHKGMITKRGGIRRHVAPEDLSYSVRKDGLVGIISKDTFVGKTFNPKSLAKKAAKKSAPKKRKVAKRNGGQTKADICRKLIRLHFPAGPDQLSQDQIIAKIADVCGLSKSLAKTYFNNNLTKAMTS